MALDWPILDQCLVATPPPPPDWDLLSPVSANTRVGIRNRRPGLTVVVADFTGKLGIRNRRPGLTGVVTYFT